jgi:hypothetical protein
MANQCHVAGFTSPLDSQNEDGTRQRSSSTEPRQKLLAKILLSRTFTRFGRPIREVASGSLECRR